MVSTQSQSQLAEKMSTPVSQDFDYATLDAKIRSNVQQRTNKIRTLMRRTAQDIIDIGQNLISVKEQLEHGQFRDWLKVEFGWSVRTAARFMRVAKKFKSANLSHLNVAASALYLLAEPSTPDEAYEETLELAKQGEIITYAKAKNVVNQHKETVKLIASKLDTIDISSKAVGWKASPFAKSSEVVQPGAARSAVVETLEDKLSEEKEASAAYSHVSNGYNHLASTANSGDYPSQAQAMISMQSLPEVGHHLYIIDVASQDSKWFGEVAEIREVTAADVEVVIKITKLSRS